MWFRDPGPVNTLCFKSIQKRCHVQCNRHISYGLAQCFYDIAWVGCVVPSCNHAQCWKRLQQKSYIHQCIHLFLYLYISIYIYIRNYHLSNLSYQSIYPSIHLPLLSSLPWKLKRPTYFFSTQQKPGPFFSAKAQSRFSAWQISNFGAFLTEYFVHDHVASLAAFNTQRKKHKAAGFLDFFLRSAVKTTIVIWKHLGSKAGPMVHIQPQRWLFWHSAWNRARVKKCAAKKTEQVWRIRRNFENLIILNWWCGPTLNYLHRESWCHMLTPPF